MPDQTLLLRSLNGKPGIRLDGAPINGEFYSEGVWARFDQQGQPRKMGGYKGTMASTALNQVRGTAFCGSNLVALSEMSILFGGTAGNLYSVYIDNNLSISPGMNVITPAGFVSASANVWRIETMHDGASGQMRVFAIAEPSLDNVTWAGTTRVIYEGDVDVPAPLTAIPSPPLGVITGIVAVFPYLVAYGPKGYVAWSVPNVPGDFLGAGSGEANITDNKIITGRILRGGGVSTPSALLWSTNSLIRMSFEGGAAVFNFDTLSTGISIMSSRSVVEMDGIYYWAGSDRFYMFNGVTRPLPNPMNSDFFFNTMKGNPPFVVDPGRVFAFANPRWNEIWWCFPTGIVAEASHALVYNTVLQTWYDTPLPASRWSDALNVSPIGRPFAWAASDLDSSLWALEYKKDRETFGGDQTAIESSITTPHVSLPYPPPGGKPTNSLITCEALEFDILQSGDMTVEILGQQTPKSNIQTVGPKTFSDALGLDLKANFKNAFRIQRFKFGSDVVGGDYVIGACLGHFRSAGERIT